MNSKLWIQKALTMCSMVALLATFSMVTLATDAKVAGELNVTGSDAVLVNGEAARSGRTIFSSSTVTTPAGTSATLNLGHAGQIMVAGGSSVVVNFDADVINVDLAEGNITVLGAANNVNVNAAGKTYSVAAGDSINAAGKDDDDNKSKKRGAAWYWFAIVFGGAAAVAVLAATRDSEYKFGGSTTVVSPNR